MIEPIIVAYENGTRELDQEEAEKFIAWRDEVNARAAKDEYKFRRAAEYPPFTDYLDGVVKNDAEQIQAYIEACLAVKAKYPKSSES